MYPDQSKESLDYGTDSHDQYYYQGSNEQLEVINTDPLADGMVSSKSNKIYADPISAYSNNYSDKLCYHDAQVK